MRFNEILQLLFTASLNLKYMVAKTPMRSTNHGCLKLVKTGDITVKRGFTILSFHVSLIDIFPLFSLSNKVLQLIFIFFKYCPYHTYSEY